MNLFSPQYQRTYLLFLFILLCIYQPVISQRYKVYNLVKDFKAIADDKTDCYAAFAKAAAAISNAGGGTLYIPKGRYYIASYKISGGNQKNFITDIIFKGCKKLTILGNNSTIRLNGKFSRNEDYKAPNVPYQYAYNNTVCAIKLVGCKNVLVKDLVLYGEVDKMQKHGGTVEGENYGVFISDDEPADVSSNIVLKNIAAHHFAADGFVIKSNGRNILIDHCKSYNNARQGLSVVKGHEIKCYYSSFDSTGHAGAYGWHLPGAGIDLENEFGPGKLSNVIIRNCTMRGNKGFQIVSTIPCDTVVVDSCFISDLTTGYSDALNGVGLYSTTTTLSNSILFAGIQVDLSDQIYKGPSILQIKNNIIYSGNRALVSSDFARPVNIYNNIFVMLPKPNLDQYFIYIQNINCRFNQNIVALHADRIKKEPNLVTILLQYCIEASNDFWLVNGYDIPVAKQKEYYYLPSTSGVKTLKDHYFGPSDVVARYNFNKTHFISIAQANTILGNRLFTAYKQNKFDRKYLLDANKIKEYTNKIISLNR